MSSTRWQNFNGITAKKKYAKHIKLSKNFANGLQKEHLSLTLAIPLKSSK